MIVLIQVRDDCLSNIRITLQEKEDEMLRQIKDVEVRPDDTDDDGMGWFFFTWKTSTAIFC